MTDLVVEVLPSLLAGDRRDQLLYVLALGLLAVGTLLAVLALRIRPLDVLAVGVACAGATAWLLSNTPGEGGTLVVVQPGNGVTLADLAALPAGLLVAYLAGRRLRGS